MSDSEILSVQELNNRGVALCAEGDFEQGIALLRQAQALSPDDPDLACSLGAALSQSGDVNGAIHFLTHAARLDPGHVAAIAILESLQTVAPEPEPQPMSRTQAYPRAQHATASPPSRPLPARPRPRLQQRRVQAPIEPEPPIIVKPKVPRRPFPWKPVLRGAAVLVVVLIIWKGVDLWVHRPQFGDRFTITQTLPDSLDNRILVLNGDWNEPASVYAPVSAELLPTYEEIIAKNAKGEYVGVRYIGDTFIGFSGSGANLTNLKSLPNESGSGAISIDDNGNIVGYSGLFTHHAVLWLNGKVIDLNDTIPTNEIVLREAVHIDDSGNIISTATDNNGNPLIVSLAAKY